MPPLNSSKGLLPKFKNLCWKLRGMKFYFVGFVLVIGVAWIIWAGIVLRTFWTVGVAAIKLLFALCHALDEVH
jgi:hypothetical protein